MDEIQYKKYHESFMANNRGTSAVYTFNCILFPILCVLFSYLMPNVCAKRKYLFEFLTIIVPMIFGFTAFADYLYQTNLVLITVNILILMKQCDKSNLLTTLCERNVPKSQRLLSVSCLRGLTYLLTIFCILAVDFRIFPRYFAKTELFGFSLMDTGVGLFVLMSGLVHKDLSHFNAMFINNANLIAILLLLGGSRFLVVKHLNYQEHLTEYGVHWNFFYTLAVTKTATSLILYCIKGNILPISILIGFAHEYLLATSLQAWVFSEGPRDGLLDANREGISSCLGYVSLYLFGVYLKNILHDKNLLRINLIFRLLFTCISLWLLTYIVNMYKPISRVLCNITYCFYVEAVVTSVILILYIYEVLLHDKKVVLPQIFVAINYNGLLYFLFANVLTGLVNITVRTLLIDVYLSLLIMHIYMLATLHFVLYLYRKGIKF